MSFKLHDYDNMHREYTFNDDGIVTVKSSQDLEGHLKRCEALRNSEAQNAKTEEFKHYASIPMVIVEQLMKKGIDIFDRNCQKDIMKEIDTNYSYLKTTNLKGW